ncbi:MAG: DUF1007 family protein, partial [Alphaproteobacteria bacterium]|nr:DUF1007 family protein [Alphaproteobacteria bacterium]
MQKNFLSGLVAALIGLFVAGAAQPAHAHPHVWIDLRSQLVFDGDGRMQGLEIDWTFDELYSAF